MADEPIAVEPTETVVEPEAVAPEPVAVEEPVIEPDWLDNPVSPEPYQQQAPPQYTQQQQQAYNQQQQQMQQPPQQPTTDAELNNFVRDPNAYLQDKFAPQMNEVAQRAMHQQMAPYMAQQNAYMEGQMQIQTGAADNAIRDMYQGEFNKDESFRGDQNVQREVQTALSGLRQQAEYQARQGNPRGLLMFQQPGFAKVTLAAVKAALGVTGGAMAPANVPHIEQTSPTAAPGVAVNLDPDTAEALRSRFGDAYVEKYKTALANEAKG